MLLLILDKHTPWYYERICLTSCTTCIFSHSSKVVAMAYARASKPMLLTLWMQITAPAIAVMLPQLALTVRLPHCAATSLALMVHAESQTLPMETAGEFALFFYH